MRRLRWFGVLVAMLLLISSGAAPSPVFGGEGGGQGQLHEWQVRARGLFEIEGVVYTDAAEQTGLLQVGVVNKGLARAVEERLKKLGIPLSSVEIVETKPIVFATTLQEYVRPLEGGLQIAFVDGGSAWLCTLGFNAVRDGVNGFVVNSHCTTDQFELDGTNHYQPWLSPSNNLIGNEIADPPSFSCARRRECRYSDAAYDQPASDVPATLGSIARPDGVNNGSLTIAGSFNVVGEAVGNAAVGTTLNKVGRTTGWTQGKVTKSKVDVAVSGTRIILLDQDFVGAEVGGGDSGSPVFEITPGTNNVTLNGILWGGASDGSFFVYSPIANVERELGSLTTFAPTSDNTPPVAHADGPYPGTEDVAIAFDGSGSYDPDGDPLTYTWDFGDGSSGTGEKPTHAYTAGGTYNVTLVVNDGKVDSEPSLTTAEIAEVNDPPVADAGPDQTVVVDEVVIFDGSGSYDDGNIISYDWDFGDGTTGSGATASHAYGTAGTYTVVLTVTDNGGATGTDSQDVTVNEAAGTMHVEAITIQLRWAGRNLKAQAEVRIVDEHSEGVPDATVTGDWRLNDLVVKPGASGVTGSDGIALINSGPIKNVEVGQTIKFCVKDVAHSSFTWDRAELCGSILIE